MSETLQIRAGGPADYDALGQLIYDAIHNGPTLYSEAQSQAWMPAPRSGPAWAERLSGKTLIVADDASGRAGFMSLEPGGYVDFAYIRPSAQGQGLFRKLFDAVKTAALAGRETSLSTHASLMAQPAFKAMGFEVVQHEIVKVDGQELKRAEMRLELGSET
ncbi:MAG: GNAT family N-acetyltransferase [Henriciella sp.]